MKDTSARMARCSFFKANDVSTIHFFRFIYSILNRGMWNQSHPVTARQPVHGYIPITTSSSTLRPKLTPKPKRNKKKEIEFRESGQARRYSWDYDENYEIFSYDRNSKKYQQLTNEIGYDAEGSYSPDGKLIAFASNRNGYAQPLSAEQKKNFETDPGLHDGYFSS